MNYESIISIHGVPRSGTSWLGEIFNSHPQVAYRFQPLFSYRFRAALSVQSSIENVQTFLEQLSQTDDDFVLQRNGKEIGQRIQFLKSESRYLVMKHVRFHHLAKTLLKEPKLKIIFLFRHPCGVVHSWLNSPEKEQGWPIDEWRHASIKNAGRPEEWNGFEKWKECFDLFYSLKKRFPDRIYFCRYEQLVKQRVLETQSIFQFAFKEKNVPQQTLDFLRGSDRSPLLGDAYGVF